MWTLRGGKPTSLCPEYRKMGWGTDTGACLSLPGTIARLRQKKLERERVDHVGRKNCLLDPREKEAEALEL